MIGVLVFTTLLAGAHQPVSCDTLDACQRMAREAIDAREFERAHDLAWLAYQRGGGRDPESLTLLARAQSLSGRADDAYVMLRRIVERGLRVPDVHSSDDFARVRAHAGWPQLQSLLEKVEVTAAPAASVTPVLPPAPAPAAAPASPPPTVTATTETPPMVTRVGADLALPVSVLRPGAIAYDAVSARFILSSAATDALMVLSQTSTNATPLTSRGWSGLDHTTALAIDRGAGDLWVAVNGQGGSVLHRLQLISGRRLDVIATPDGRPGRLIALALSGDGLYALDAEHRRVLRRAPAGKTLVSYATLPPEIDPTGLAASRTALYIAHRDGLLRLDVATRRPQPVTATTDKALSGLRSLAWHDGMLFGIQVRDGNTLLVRLALNRSGTTVTAVQTLGPAASDVGTFAGGAYYYVAVDEQNQRMLRGIAAR